MTKGLMRFCAGVALLLGSGVAPAADEAAVVYPTATLGIPGSSPESYVDRYGGDDLLPYTADDIDVPDGGNPFGLWGFVHFDNNSDAKITADEHIFAVGEASSLFSAASRPEYGVLYEAEDWYGAVESRGEGPTGSPPGEDFEVNDHNGWTDESNAYAYNNLGANQHGNGHGKYYFNYRTAPGAGESYAYDEISGFQKTFTFRNTNDDPDTAFPEKGDCRRFYTAKAGEGIGLQGYFIPVDDLAGLKDGSLPTLNGWETVDLAQYLRDTIAPKLAHPEITNKSGDVGELGEASHIALVQISVPFDVTNTNGECGGTGQEPCSLEADPGLCQVQNHATYWGLTPTGGVSTYRSSSIFGFSAPFVDTAFGGAVHAWLDTPDDSSQRNIWLQDHYWRAEKTNLGKYTFEGLPTTTWTIINQPDPAQATYDQTNDFVMVSSGPGTASAPLPKALGLGETNIEAVADLAEDITLPVEGAGGGVPATAFQIILRNGDNVIAYADISAAATAVHIGGTFSSATGLATLPGPTGTGAGATIEVVNADPLGPSGAYTRFVLIVTPTSVSLRQVVHGYTVNDFLDIDSVGTELATVSTTDPIAFGDGVTTLSVATTGRGVIDTLLLFASPGVGPFVRGNANNDRHPNGDARIDLSDGVAILNFLFLGGTAPPCMAAADSNADKKVDLSDGVYLLNYLFTGGPAPKAPHPATAYSQGDGDKLLGCATPHI